MGRISSFTEIEDQYLRENYLLKPLMHLCNHINRPYTTVRKRLKRLGLLVPKETADRFKTTHRAIGAPSTAPNKYYTPVQKEPKPTAKIKVDKKEERVLKTKVVDYSTKILVRVDHKTWVYRDK